MISLSHNFIFVHVPRTGGTAIETALQPYAEPVLTGVKEFCGPRRAFHKHATATMIRDGIGEVAFARAFKFTFVRDEKDWLTSNYRAGRGVHFPYITPDLVADQATFDSVKHAASFDEWLPRWLALCRPSQRAIFCEDGRPLVDFIGRFERLDEDFAEACHLIGLPPLALSRVNVSPRLTPV